MDRLGFSPDSDRRRLTTIPYHVAKMMEYHDEIEQQLQYASTGDTNEADRDAELNRLNAEGAYVIYDGVSAFDNDCLFS